jgi:uncharacterized protein YmfQ (DUF2313 family)
MNIVETLLQSLPPVAYDRQAATVVAEMRAISAPLEAAVARADQILVEHDPATTQLSLPDWERVYGLPDPCAGLSSSIERRRADVITKITACGNLSTAQMIQVVEQHGYPGATVQDFAQMTCADSCDSAVYGENWQFVWQINVPQSLAIETMTCMSPCDTQLRRWGNEAIFCAMQRFKPAHTLALVNFG